MKKRSGFLNVLVTVLVFSFMIGTMVVPAATYRTEVIKLAANQKNTTATYAFSRDLSVSYVLTKWILFTH